MIIYKMQEGSIQGQNSFSRLAMPLLLHLQLHPLVGTIQENGK